MLSAYPLNCFWYSSMSVPVALNLAALLKLDDVNVGIIPAAHAQCQTETDSF